MNEAQSRQNVLSIMQGWIGLKQGDKSHKVIIDTYNSHKPLARGHAMSYTEPYCAATVSAAAIKAGYTDIIPTECSCTKMIELLKEIDSFEENDGYIPEPADLVFYDWDDNGKGECTGRPDHVGFVEKVVGSTITAIEGNKGNAHEVARRNLQINGRYIRGYGVPKYEKVATDSSNPSVETDELKIGDIVSFTGSKHYTSSYSGAKSSPCRSGKARITAISKGKPHPYHLKAVSGGGSNVYGWVDGKDVAEFKAEKEEIKIGDTVTFSGTTHYTNCYEGAKGKSCKGGLAKVKDIKKGKPHPYLLVKSGKGCTVNGWTDADDVSK